MGRFTIAILGLLVLAAPAAAQRLVTSPFPSIGEAGAAAADASLPAVAGASGNSEGDGVGMVFAGLAGGFLGAAIGTVLGGSCAELSCEPGAIYGLVIGEALGVATGVHLAGGSRGDLGTSVLASLAISGGGIAAAALTDRGVVLLAVPVLQIAAAIGHARRAEPEDGGPI